jgi:hypothetical protein
MKHKHHILPKHMGGTDEENNIIELTIEEHAEAHKTLYEKYGHWQDYLAWKGLAGLLSSAECRFLSMIEGAIKGSAIANGGFLYTNGDKIEKYMPWEVPVGWSRYKPSIRKSGVGSGTSKRKWYYNPDSNEKICLLPDEDIPSGWLPGQGKKKKTKCCWYNNGNVEGQFEMDKEPTGWQRGRLKGIYGGTTGWTKRTQK